MIITLNGELSKLQDKNGSTEEIFVYDLPVEKPTGGAMSQSVYYANDSINYINNPN